MRGVFKVKEILEKGVSQGRPILLYGDPDVDGLMSLKLMCDLCSMLGLEYDYYINGNRHHGLSLSTEQLRGYLVIMADFSVSREEIQQLIASDVYTIVLDHHEINDDFIEYENAVVINNQYSFEPEEDRYLSGAGVVYEVFSNIYPDFKSNERQAIVGITLLSDIRQIENQKAKYYLKKTFATDSPYMSYLIDQTLDTDYGFGAPKMDRSYIDYTFSPTVNALLRFNKTADAIKLVLGEGTGNYVYQRTRQKELIDKMDKQVEVLELTSCYIIAVNSDLFQEDITSFIGLLCSKYKNKGKSSLIFAHSNGKVIRASFRGLYDDVNYHGAFRSIGIQAEGHKGAFGIPTFSPTQNTWGSIDAVIHELELNHEDTRVILESSNLSAIMLSRGSKIAYENCFVRDMYRTYIRYNGVKARITRHTYKMEELTEEDYYNQVEPDIVKKGVKYKYLRDSNGDYITKYLEYTIDGRTVKSFGVTIEEGLIMPILEKGYIQLYLV